MLAQALVREGLRNVAAGANPMSLKKGIEAAVERVSEELSKIAKDVETKEQIGGYYLLEAEDIDAAIAIAARIPAARMGGEVAVRRIEER